MKIYGISYIRMSILSLRACYMPTRTNFPMLLTRKRKDFFFCRRGGRSKQYADFFCNRMSWLAQRAQANSTAPSQGKATSRRKTRNRQGSSRITLVARQRQSARRRQRLGLSHLRTPRKRQV